MYMTDPDQTDPTVPRDGLEVMKRFLPISPFVAKLGVIAELLAPDRVRLRLPWDSDNVTVGDMVHGGAIAALVDITAMAAAWSGAPLPTQLRGVTTSMAIEFINSARATDLIGHGRVLRRGGYLTNCDIEILHPEGGLVAKGIAAYKIG